MAKAIRMRISREFPGVLQFEGMKKSEHGARDAWNQLSAEDRAKTIARAKKNLKTLASQVAEKVTA